jgi:DNA-binding SARP family transcriptional activator
LESGAAMSRLIVFLLGPSRIKLDGVLVEIELRKAVALLAYLVVTGRSYGRDALSTLLWPGSDQSRARSYLRHMLWSIKKTLIEWGERALTLAKHLHAEAATVHALNNVGAARLYRSEADRRRAMLQESVRRALEANLRLVHELGSVIERGRYNSRFSALPLLNVCHVLVRHGTIPTRLRWLLPPYSKYPALINSTT